MAFALYSLLALAAYWPIWPGDPSRLPSCACGDQVQQVWFLTWTPFALFHGHNPFLTTYVDFPTGANLAVNTLMPLLGFIGAPVTVLFGGVATLNLWLWLSFPLSAIACFVLLRRFVRWTPAAFVGGLFYGFSPYMAGQGLGHLNLTFVPFPPLVLLLAHELLVRQRRKAVLTGLLLGVVAAAQYLVSSEIFASTLVLAIIGTLVLVAARPAQVSGHARHALVGVGVAVAVCGSLIAYPLSVQLAGPHRFAGSAHGTYPFGADLLGLVVPTVRQLIAPARLVAVSNRFILGDITENGSYLGVALVLLLVALVVWRWRSPVVRFAAAMAVVAQLLALGPTLTVDSHVTGFPLPDRLLDHLPFFTSFIDARFSLYVDLFGAVLLAVGLQHLRSALRGAGRVRPPTGWWRPATLGMVVAVVVVPLIPNWPYPAVPASVPTFFSTRVVDRIPPGSVVMTYPYAQSTSDQAQLWQAVAAMRFRLMGGYALVPGPGGLASYDAFPAALTSVPATLTGDAEGVAPSTVAPGAVTASPGDARRFLERYHIATVVADPVGSDPAAALSLLQAAIGVPPARIDGVEVWFGVQTSVERSHRR